MYVASLKIILSLAIAVISVLIRKHAYIFSYGTVTLILQCHGSTCRTGIIIVERILQGEVLQIGVLTTVQ